MITILIVDDQAIIRLGLQMRLQLESDLQVVGEAKDGLEALEQAQLLQPDVILMAVDLPGTLNGIGVTAILKAKLPDTAVIILTLRNDTRTRLWAESAGAVAVVAKYDIHNLLVTIREVCFHNVGQVSG